MLFFLRPSYWSSHWLGGLFLLSISLLSIGLPAYADGFLLPHLPNHSIAPLPELPNFAIKYHKVDVEINHPLARTRVDQVFHNPSARELEGTYLFPIPSGASLSQFAMDVDGKMTKAELLESNQARQIYEEIVRRRIDPGLLEYAGSNLYRARVFPIPARGDKRIQLSYDQLLPTQSNLHTYRYTLSTEKFSAKPLEKVSVTIKLKTKTPLKSVYSPSHELKITRQGEFSALISYEASQVKPDTDFEIYYTTAEDPIGLSLLSYRESQQDGYFMLLGAPQVEWKQNQNTPKHLTFILDTSGSMAGDKIKQAKAALEYNLNQLAPQDSFHLISFSDTVEPFSKAALPASSANIRKAIAHVQKLEATGGTDIDSALQLALKQQGPRQMNLIVFLTDGDPTVGETNFQTILSKARKGNQNKARLFVFGVGFDVNIPFLDKLSLENRGSSEYVRPEENIEVKVSSLFSRISHPILADLKLDFGQTQVYDLYPRELPDLFKGSQMVLVGRYRQAGPVSLSLSGVLQGKAQKFVYSGQRLSAEKTAHAFLPRLWATRKIGFLLDQIRLKGKNQELVAEVIRLSKAYGIITEFTSFLVREDVDVRRPAESAPMREEADGYLSRSLGEAKGSWAISQSRNAQKMQDNVAPAAANRFYDEAGQEQQITQVRYVGQRAFYQKKNLWQDAAVADKLPRLPIARYSELYFALSQNAELRQILALGPELEFVHGGYLIQIGEKGQTKTTAELKKKLALP